MVACGSIDKSTKAPKVMKMEITDPNNIITKWCQFKIGILTYLQIHNTVKKLDDMTRNVQLNVRQ